MLKQNLETGRKPLRRAGESQGGAVLKQSLEISKNLHKWRVLLSTIHRHSMTGVTALRNTCP